MTSTPVERVIPGSHDVVGEQREALRAMFPEVFSEGKIDFDKLKATLGELVDDRPERYGFSLTAHIEVVEGLPGPTIWQVIDDDKGQSFHICLDPGLTLETTNALGLDKDDLFICRDIALDDTEAANLALQCRLKTI